MQIDLFEQVIFWPFRLVPSGPLLAKRCNPDVTPQEWLDAYAEWISRKTPEGNPWRTTGTSFAEAFGFRGKNEREARLAEFNYFHPFVQQILHPEPGQAPMRVLRRDDVRFVRIQLEEKEAPWEFPVNRLQLFLFPTDIAILALQWGWKTPTGGPTRPLTMQDALRLLNRARRIYPPYWDEKNGSLVAGQFPYKIDWLDERHQTLFKEQPDIELDDCHAVVGNDRRPPVSRHWRCLVNPIVTHGPALNTGSGKESLLLKQVEDERCPTMAYIGVAEPQCVPLAIQTNLALLDEGEDFSYSRPFLQHFERDHCYDRYWDWSRSWNTRYLFSSWSFVALGRSSPDELGREPFFVKHIKTHFERHYFLMMLIARMQKASLLVFWSRLAETMHEYSGSKSGRRSRDRFHRDVKWLMSDLADFVSRYWFSEVSNQVQARELFETILRHLGTQKLYGEVMEQTRFVREVLLSALNEEKARFDEGIARISLYVVPLYLTMSLLGMSWLSEWLKAQGWLRFLYVGLLFGVLLLLARLLQPRRAVPALDGKRR